MLKKQRNGPVEMSVKKDRDEFVDGSSSSTKTKRVVQKKEIKLKIKATPQEADEFERFSTRLNQVRPIFDDLSSVLSKMDDLCHHQTAYHPRAESEFEHLKSRADQLSNQIRTTLLAHQNAQDNRRGPFAEVKGQLVGTLLTELVSQTNRHKTILEKHDKGLRGRVGRHLAQVAEAQSARDEEEAATPERYDPHMNTDTFFKRYVFTEKQHAKAKHAHELLSEQNQDIVRIEKELTELNQLMLDIGSLVDHQAELLDRAEMNLGEAKAAVALGNQELQETRVIVKQIRRKKLMTILTIGLIVIIVIVVVIVIIAIL